MSLQRIWTQHLKGADEKKEFTRYVLNSNQLLDRLEQIIDIYTEELRRSEQTEDYSSPAWSHLQADRLGQLKSLGKIRQLLNRKVKDE